MRAELAPPGPTLCRDQIPDSLSDKRAQVEAELEDIRMLQRISSELIYEHDIEALYEKIVDAAVAIMRSDYASMQMLYPERGRGGELRLLAFHGFNAEAAKFWTWVTADSQSTCGVVLRTGKRVVASDIASCEFMAGSEDRQVYLQTGIHACQTTPLVARSGNVVGMISTHWRIPHQPSERDFDLFDILARQAADLIELRRTQEALRRSEAMLRLNEERLRLTHTVSKVAPWQYDPITELFDWSAEVLQLFGNSGFGSGLQSFLSIMGYADDRARAVAALAAVGRRDKDCEFAFRYVHHDGEVKLITARARPFYNQGSPVVLGVFIDTTPAVELHGERRRASLTKTSRARSGKSGNRKRSRLRP
jgi:PAS domain S-box-containing protein